MEEETCRERTKKPYKQMRTPVHPAQSTQPAQPASNPTDYKNMFGTFPEREDILPKEGENWGKRLGKNVLSASLSAAGVEIGYFFKYWKW
ncbi:MAG: hypothetical protein ACXAEU_22935 [Candidatus Hodarchaeales archaeon]